MGIFAGNLPLLAVGFVTGLAVRSLEVLFALGMIGSAVVVLITFLEDLKEVFSDDDARQPAARVASTEHIHA